ncbi:MAG: ABC transporter ATP-binding protein [Bacillaceae bacterium]
MMGNILRGENISKKYNNRIVVNSTSFDIERGKIYVIEGRSGSGKSTLLSILGGLEKPSGGKVFFENESFYDLNDKKQSNIRGNSFGFVFQSFQLVPELTVEENINLPKSFIHNTNGLLSVNELAQELGITDQLNKRPDFLSGGEQQRVAIARALITRPKILYADEPTGNLDEHTSSLVMELLLKLNKKYGMSLVIVTHEKNLVKEPHQLFRMDKGVLKMETQHD